MAIAAAGVVLAAGSTLAGIFNLQIVALVAALAGLGLALSGLLRLNAALAEVTTVCARLSKGDFEARLQGCREHGKFGQMRESFNDMIDRCDAFVREAGAAMAAVRDNKYYRHILPQGLHGSRRIAS